jgi:hypothetical protein
MSKTRPLQILATLAALGAVTFGLGTYTHADLTSIHMIFGFIVAAVLLIIAVMAVSTSGLRRLGAIGIVYAFILPLFGLTQQMILQGDLHWLIQAAHLVVSFGSIPFIGAISARFAHQKASTTATSASARVA